MDGEEPTFRLSDEVRAVLAEGPAYGLRIIERISQRTGRRPHSGIYALLRHMEQAGELTSEEKFEAPHLRGGRPRRYYSLKPPPAL